MESVLDWAELIVAVLVILSVAKSGYNGWVHTYVVARLRKAENAHERVKEVDKKLDQVQETQEQTTDVLVALGEAVNGDKEFDVEKFERETNRDGGDRFLQD